MQCKWKYCTNKSYNRNDLRRKKDLKRKRKVLGTGAAPRGRGGGIRPPMIFNFIIILFTYFYFLLVGSARRSVMLMILIPLSHYDNFWGKFLVWKKKMYRSPPSATFYVSLSKLPIQITHQHLKCCIFEDKNQPLF